MEQHLTQSAAIIALHEKGFTNDFQLQGNLLLWIQGRILLTADDFSILECYEVQTNTGDQTAILLFGIIIFPYNEKGILLNPFAQLRKTGFHSNSNKIATNGKW
ncbi:MAG: hypothetical protein EOP49_20890 [Sphingobacteriales bacterium]|nr:MAG: hypothetical protein EOP49_20890 [Sphingobacteriales bacterium]